MQHSPGKGTAESALPSLAKITLDDAKNTALAMYKGLSPGEYRLIVDVGSAVLPHCGEAHVIVQEGHVTQVELECDSGMR